MADKVLVVVEDVHEDLLDRRRRVGERVYRRAEGCLVFALHDARPDDHVDAAHELKLLAEPEVELSE